MEKRRKWRKTRRKGKWKRNKKKKFQMKEGKFLFFFKEMFWPIPYLNPFQILIVYSFGLSFCSLRLHWQSTRRLNEVAESIRTAIYLIDCMVVDDFRFPKIDLKKCVVYLSTLPRNKWENSQTNYYNNKQPYLKQFQQFSFCIQSTLA